MVFVVGVVNYACDMHVSWCAVDVTDVTVMLYCHVDAVGNDLVSGLYCSDVMCCYGVLLYQSSIGIRDRRDGCSIECSASYRDMFVDKMGDGPQSGLKDHFVSIVSR